MRGIDIFHGDSPNESSKLKDVPEKAYKESDFVIVKATQGVSYKYTPFFYKMIDRIIKDGKLAGVYHYAAGNDPVKEADYFLKIIKNYIGKVMLCLDWEGEQNPKFGNKEWCTKFINRVKEKTGITCTLYTGTDGCKQNITLAGKVPLWFAGYPKPMVTGWTLPKWKYDLGKWGKPLIWQYTSSNGKCDRNTTNMTKEQWLQHTKANTKTETTKTKSPVINETEEQLRDSVVNALNMLIGIKEGSKEHKMIIDTFNKSGLCPRYKMGVHDAWCATAVSFAFIVNKVAGKPGSGALCQFVECSCAKMIELGKKQGVFVENDAYVPKKGDVIFYDWQDSGSGDNKGTPDHVGLVEYVHGDSIRAVEGNKNDCVGKRTIKVNAKTIRGFIVPQYAKYCKPSAVQTTVTTKTPVTYYPKYTGKSNSIVDALKSIGVKDPTIEKRTKIAKANGISGYSGLASQNNTLLTLLKAGKLKKA